MLDNSNHSWPTSLVIKILPYIQNKNASVCSRFCNFTDDIINMKHKIPHDITMLCSSNFMFEDS